MIWAVIDLGNNEQVVHRKDILYVMLSREQYRPLSWQVLMEWEDEEMEGFLYSMQAAGASDPVITYPYKME